MHISTSRLGRPLACACLCAAVAQAALTVEVGGVKLDDTVPELAFYTALLKIWIGGQPADAVLRTHLLGDVA
jgi:hypothetical protein